MLSRQTGAPSLPHWRVQNSRAWKVARQTQDFGEKFAKKGEVVC
jgi:hypothetical protein